MKIIKMMLGAFVMAVIFVGVHVNSAQAQSSDVATPSDACRPET